MTKHTSTPAAYAAAVPPAGDRPNDITVFGCTGNAGRAVALHVIKSATIAQSAGAENVPPPLRVGLAGRNPDKVRTVLEGIRDELGLGPVKDGDVNIIVADASDPDSMLSMARSSRVVISCAGPYNRYGEAAIVSCIEGGAHYVDITGEVPWIERMISEHGETAEKSGVTLLPFSGYDCVPAELGMYLSGKALEQAATGEKGDDGIGVVSQVNLAIRNVGGGFPRGTLETILDSVEGKMPQRREGDQWFYPKEYRTAAKMALSPSSFILPKWSHHFGTYTAPNLMTTVNVPILCRSAPTFGFSEDITISDRSIVSGKPSLLNGLGLIPSQIFITGLLFGGLAMALPPFRWFLRRRLKTYSYNGDPLARVIADAEAVSKRGRDVAVATARLSVPGDAGIYATGLFAAAVANALHEVTSTPATKGRTSLLPPAGFHPPVAALRGCRPGVLTENLGKLGAEVSIKLTTKNGESKAIDPATIGSSL